jgi:hypothetical protein
VSFFLAGPTVAEKYPTVPATNSAEMSISKKSNLLSWQAGYSIAYMFGG